MHKVKKPLFKGLGSFAVNMNRLGDKSFLLILQIAIPMIENLIHNLAPVFFEINPKFTTAAVHFFLL